MTTEPGKTALSSSFQNDEFSQKLIPSCEKNIFNSKLFIDLDGDYTHSSNNFFSSECETDIDIEDDINNKGCFLIKDLIDELDFHEEKKSEENHQIFLSLVNKGYEYIPKKYILQQKKGEKDNNVYNNKIKIYNNNNYPKKKVKNNIKERKGDWVCQFCCNINFAFRTVCNRCKGKKEVCLQKIIM